MHDRCIEAEPGSRLAIFGRESLHCEMFMNLLLAFDNILAQNKEYWCMRMADSLGWPEHFNLMSALLQRRKGAKCVFNVYVLGDHRTVFVSGVQL